ncbi:MAG TPA: hypothetical protein VEW48_20440 [Thermoanaerobaculia bacterium]|nr:hypothetical protein [Thermoanaerobaculia bacterium]
MGTSRAGQAAAIGLCAFATLLLGLDPEPFIRIAKSSLLMMGGG